MAGKLVIAVDCDDVLVSTSPFFVDLYNKTYGTNGTLEHAHFASPDVWKADEQTILDRWYAMTEHEDYKKLAPTAQEVAVLRRLAEVHDLHLVTARKEVERDFTEYMLDQHLKGVFQSMTFVGWTGSKGDICNNLQADVLIDDSFRHLASAHDCGVSNLLWFGDYPWQTDVPGDVPVVRCAGWQEVEKEIGQIANRKTA